MAICSLNLVAQNVKQLMPDLIGQHHDSFLHKYAKDQECYNVNSTDHIPLMGKCKNGYLKLVHLKLQPQHSVEKGFLVVGTFQVRKSLVEEAYLLIDNEYRLLNMTACKKGLENALGL